ncbi:MAG: C40 family peptidase [Flavobacteriales bacterium]
MKKLFALILFGLLFTFQSLAQDRKVDVLEILYNQKNYRSIVRKTTKMIDKRGYEDNELVHLFKAVALARLSQDSRYTNSHSEVLKESAIAYQNYYELDKQLKFQQESSCLLEDLRLIYKKSNYTKIEKESYDYLQNQETKDPVVQKKRVVVVKNQPGKKVDYKTDFKASAVDTVCEELYVEEVDKMINYAKKFIGVPYVFGGTGDGGFDCSGYTQYVLGKYGTELPRNARSQKDFIEQIKIKEAKKGDLVFFSRNKSKNNITHVGIVISEPGEDIVMIHASSSQGIMITNVSTNSYWLPKLVAAGRPPKEES